MHTGSSPDYEDTEIMILLRLEVGVGIAVSTTEFAGSIARPRYSTAEAAKARSNVDELRTPGETI